MEVVLGLAIFAALIGTALAVMLAIGERPEVGVSLLLTAVVAVVLISAIT